MHRTAIGYAAAFRVYRSTATEIGSVVVMSALQELHALLRRTRARRRQRRTPNHHSDNIVDVVVVIIRAVFAISQKCVQVVMLGVGNGWKIINTGRRPRCIDTDGTRCDILVVLATTIPGILIVLSAVELAQVRFLVAPGGPATALPPSLRTKHRCASSPRQARHASSYATNGGKRDGRAATTTSGPTIDGDEVVVKIDFHRRFLPP